MSLVPRKIFYDDFWNDIMPSIKEGENMKCDIYEKNGNCFIEMDIPGYNKNDINIDIENNYLTVSAKKEENHEEKDKKFIRKERIYGSISRSFYVGEINEEQIKAEFNDGVLSITLPKEQKENNKKRIEIK